MYTIHICLQFTSLKYTNLKRCNLIFDFVVNFSPKICFNSIAREYLADTRFKHTFILIILKKKLLDAVISF